MANAPVAGPLVSDLLRGNNRLQQCAQFDFQHVKPRDPQSEHVRLIQEALRQVFGADIPASETDYGDATTAAVVAFKTDRGLFTRGSPGTVDEIVGINTIRTLDALLKTEDNRRRGHGGGGAIDPQVVVRPDGPIPGEADHFGFSATRLARSGPGEEWSRRDAARPISQFIPAGRRRTLIVKAPGGVGFRIDKEQIASIESFDQGSVTLRGNAPGHALLSISVEGSSLIKVDVVVRAATTISVDVFHLGPPKFPGATATFQAVVIPAVNAIYTAQTNITFVAGATRDITVMAMDGNPTMIDTDLPLFYSELIGPPDPRRPTLRFQDLQREVKNPRAVTCFISPNIRDEEGPDIGGRGGVRSRVCWFKVGAGAFQSARGAPAHEFGHSIGLPHITAFGTDNFLMHPTGDAWQNNTIIPSETLDDLMY